jgi:fucose permease
LLKGVLAQFFYVGAQIGVASFVIRFAQYSMPGLPEKQAANYLKLHLLGFMIGRFAGSAIMKRMPASRLLSLFGMSALICLTIVLLGTGRNPGEDANQARNHTMGVTTAMPNAIGGALGAFL